MSGTARSGDIPINFVYPLGAADLPVGSRIAIYDGSTELDVQEENWSSDRDGNRRLVSGVAMWRGGSISGLGSQEFDVASVVGSPITGTPITDADILATDYDTAVTIVLSNGSTYTASARSILGAGAGWSGTNNGGNPQRKGTWREGPFCTEIIGSVSLKTGGTPHAFLRVQCHVAAYKADAGAVSGGNPILYIRTHLSFDNGYLFVASPTDLFGGATITTGLASPVNIVSDPNNPGNVDLSTQTPAATLTISASSTAGNGTTTATAARSAGTWTKDDIGRILEDNSGRRMRIWAWTDATHVTVNNYAGANEMAASTALDAAPFATAIPNGTYTSGNWKEYGFNHFYGGKWHVKTWWGLNADMYTTADWAQMRASKVFPNWSAPIGNYAAADVSYLNLQKEPTTRYGRPFRGPGELGGNSIDFDNGGQTDSVYINLVPDWFHRLSQDWTFNGRRQMEENAQALMSVGHAFRYEATGDFIDFTNSSVPLNTLYWHGSANSPTKMAVGSNYWYWRYGGILDASHLPDPFMPLYMFTGDFLWLEEMQHIAQVLWLWANTENSATGYNRGDLNDAAAHYGGQERGTAWFLRSIFNTLIATPDTFTLTSHNKTHYYAWIDAQMAFGKTAFVDDTTTWKVNGPKLYQVNASGLPAWGAFPAAFMGATLAHARNNALLNSNGIANYDWYMQQFIAAFSTSGANALNVPMYLAGAYGTMLIGTKTGIMADAVQVASFGDMYEVVAKGTNSGTYSGNFGNTYNTHGRTITAVGGTAGARVLTFDAPYFLPTGGTNAWYIGGYVMVVSVFTIIAAGVITAVNSAGTQVTVDDTVSGATYQQAGIAFAASSYGTSTAIMLPLPYPTIYPGSTIFALSAGSPYFNLLTQAVYYTRFISAIAPLVDRGVSGAAAAYTAALVHLTDSGLGAGIVPSDFGAPLDTLSGLWGAKPAGWVIEPL